MKKIILSAVAAGLLALSGAASAADHPLHVKPRDVHFHHQGVFGTFDRAQLQRGFQVYKEVCAACHGLNLMAFRTLQDIGFSENEVKAIAAGYEVPDLDDKGEAITRPAKPSDKKPGPYANELQARAANGGAYPPDQSLIVKARHDGEAYLYSLLTGYGKTPPATFQEKNPDTGEMMTVKYEVPEGLHYNPYFATTQIAMAQPMQDGQVEYADGTQATVDQMARDVTAFLSWVAEPKMEERKRMGVAVMIFLSIFTVIAFFSYRRIWADVKGH
jgi:ubiquinol-cytochrome c reductase cytochrome c1 subunit